MYPSLFDLKHIALSRSRYLRAQDFLLDMMLEEVEQKLKDHGRIFKKMALIAIGSQKYQGAFGDDVELIEFDESLEFQSDEYDAILHIGSLGVAGDVIGQMVQSRLKLAKDGVFIAAFIGGASLQELRIAMMETDIELFNGALAHVAPMIDLRDAGALLQRAGLALPVADNWVSRVEYANLEMLINDLRTLALQNPLKERPRIYLGKDYLPKLKRSYANQFSCKNDGIYASFELIFLTGYAPSDEQPKPLRRGSINSSLETAIEKSKEH